MIVMRNSRRLKHQIHYFMRWNADGKALVCPCRGPETGGANR